MAILTRILPCPRCVGGVILKNYGMRMCINCGYNPDTVEELKKLRKEGYGLEIKTGWKHGRPRSIH